MVELTYRCPDSHAWAILKISSPSGAFTLERMLMRGDFLQCLCLVVLRSSRYYPQQFQGNQTSILLAVRNLALALKVSTALYQKAALYGATLSSIFFNSLRLSVCT